MSLQLRTSSRPRLLRALTMVCAAACGADAAAAQGTGSPAPEADGAAEDSVRVFGRVVDRSTGREVTAAAVTFRTPGAESRIAWRGVADGGGGFRTTLLPHGSYDLRVQAVGFTLLEEEVELEGPREMDLRVELVPDAVQLDPIVVRSERRRSRLELSGFYERRARGLGRTRTREEIERIAPMTPADIFRGIPGVRVVQVDQWGNDLRMRGNCRPRIVIDGFAAPASATIDELLAVEDIEAIEVHSGATAPARFGTSSCGFVLAWTREGSRRDGDAMSGLRAFIGGALVGAIIFLGLR